MLGLKSKVIITLHLVIFSLTSLASEVAVSPVLPKGSPTLVGDTSEVIWADSSASSNIFNSTYSLWNPVTGELKKLAILNDFFLYKAVKSDAGVFLLGSESQSTTQKIIFITSAGKVISANLPYAQHSSRIIVLTDQSALVVGGETGGNKKQFTNEVQHITVSNDALTVERLPDVPIVVNRGYFLLALNDGRAMIMGGSSENYVGCELCVADTFILDPKTKSWNSGPRMLEPRSEAVAAMLPDGSVLVAGGWTPEHSWNSAEASRSTERWMPLENRFVADTPLPFGVARPQLTWAAGQQGKQLLLMGGMRHAWTGNDEILDYDVASGQWRNVGNNAPGAVDARTGALLAGSTVFDKKMLLWRFNYSPMSANIFVPLNVPSPDNSRSQPNPIVAAPIGPKSTVSYHSNISANFLLSEATSPARILNAVWWINQGADVNIRNSEGLTLLMLANKYWDIKSIQTLINKGADINAKSSDGSTDLMLATQSGRTDVVQLLLTKQVDLNAKNQAGKTALINALEFNQLGLVQILIDKGAIVNIATNDGITPLMLAADQGHLDVVKALLVKGAEVNAKAGNGKTALMYAAERGQVEVVTALVANGADAGLTLNDGKNAMMLAAANNHPDVVQVLKAQGAKINTKSNDHVINIVQLDRYSGTIGKHPVTVVLGNTGREISGYYHYGLGNQNSALLLGGSTLVDGKWQMQETIVTNDSNAKPKQSGLWELSAVAEGWQGFWKKADGSGALPITLHKDSESVDYAVVSYLNNESETPPAAPACSIRVFRHQHVAETIDASNDTDDCLRTDVSFPDLNFDGHADLIYNIDTPAHNFSFALKLYDAAKKTFVDAGVLPEPAVDPVHKNIFVIGHYSAGAHSASIYQFQKGNAEPTLIREMTPCSYRDKPSKDKSSSCFENYEYDMKTGKIIGVDN